MEVVGAHHAHARDLFDVAMAVDAARQHPAARGVDVARAGRELRRDFHDHAVAHADVGVEGAVCLADPAVAGRGGLGGSLGAISTITPLRTPMSAWKVPSALLIRPLRIVRSKEVSVMAWRA